MAPSGTRCDGCGRATAGEAAAGRSTADAVAAGCPTGGRCRGRYEPPRYCTECGRRLRVVVTPVGWTATCRDHGAVVR